MEGEYGCHSGGIGVEMEQFVQTKNRRKLPGIQDPTCASEGSIRAFETNLEAAFNTVVESALFGQIERSLETVRLERIRCVALGSPCQEEPALYQLALLMAIAKAKGVDEISLYDPVFTRLDKAYFEKVGYIVEEQYTPVNLHLTLYFLPHAPLTLTSCVLNEHPRYLLSNNVLSHTERMSKSGLYEKYPLLARVVYQLEQSTRPPVDDFQPVVSKRKNRRPNKNRYVEKELDYSIIDAYFSKPSLTSYKEFEEGPWLNSFTDLSLHVLE